MNKIKFSHEYDKLKYLDFNLNGIKPIPIILAKLLETVPVNLEDLHESFLAYDTDSGKCELPDKGKYIMLIFKKTRLDIFTTIRRYTPQKYDYYRSKRGDIFEIVIETPSGVLRR